MSSSGRKLGMMRRVQRAIGRAEELIAAIHRCSKCDPRRRIGRFGLERETAPVRERPPVIEKADKLITDAASWPPADSHLDRIMGRQA